MIPALPAVEFFKARNSLQHEARPTTRKASRMTTGKFESNRRRSITQACPEEHEKENNAEVLDPLSG